MGRPSLAPGNYFRALLIGYFEGIDSERGIAWRLADSIHESFWTVCRRNDDKRSNFAPGDAASTPLSAAVAGSCAILLLSGGSVPDAGPSP